jgi:hypothetical protein
MLMGTAIRGALGRHSPADKHGGNEDKGVLQKQVMQGLLEEGRNSIQLQKIWISETRSACKGVSPCRNDSSVPVVIAYVVLVRNKSY